jgi:hypothetical protein
MGGSNTRRLMSQNVVAICDVDEALVDAQLKRMGDDATSIPPRHSNRSRRPPYPRRKRLPTHCAR